MPPPSPPRSEPSTGLLVINGARTDDDVRVLCERLERVIASSDATLIVCDVAALSADARAIEALARLQLTARRNNSQIHLHRASPELQQLLDFAGLADVVPSTASWVKPQAASAGSRTAGTAARHRGSS